MSYGYFSHLENNRKRRALMSPEDKARKNAMNREYYRKKIENINRKKLKHAKDEIIKMPMPLRTYNVNDA